MLKRGGAIDEQTPDAAVHELRLVAKKLRYLMEFSRPLFESREIGAQIKVLKRLQDCLGDFNDYTVHRAAIEHAAEELATGDPAPVATLLAAGRLAENLQQRQHDERRRFHTVFSGYASRLARARAKQLFGKSRDA